MCTVWNMVVAVTIVLGLVSVGAILLFASRTATEQVARRRDIPGWRESKDAAFLIREAERHGR
jgi:hypothetical protein